MIHHPSIKSLAVAMALAVLTLTGGCGQRQPQPFESGTRIMIGGDTHFGENYARDGSADSDSAALVDTQRYQRSLAGLKPFVQNSAFALVNLETPMSPELSDGLTDKDYVHWANPAMAVPALSGLGIDAVGLGNNHSYDQGESGLRKSLVALASSGIRTFGANTSEASAQAPLLQEIVRPGGGKATVAFFGMLEERPIYRDKYKFYAGPHKAGVAPVNLAGFKSQVTALRKRYTDLFVIAFPHWGENYAWAEAGQVDLGRGLVDAGADMVVGQHAHTVQEIERYRGRWILYGIGNFAFLAPGRYQRFGKIQPLSMIVRLSFGSDPNVPPAVRLYPILSDNRATRFQPGPANAAQATGVFSAIQSRRKSIGFDAQLHLDDPLGPALELRRRRWAGIW